MITLNRLKGKEKINTLFRKGTIHRTKLLLLKVLMTSDEENRLYAGVSVPKKIFYPCCRSKSNQKTVADCLKNARKGDSF